MKEYLLTKIKPFTEEYINKLITLNTDLTIKEKELEKETKKAVELQKTLSGAIKVNNDKLQIKKEDYEKKTADQQDINNNLKNEISVYTKLSTEADTNKRKTKIELDTAVAERKMVYNELEKQRQKTKQYDLKLDTLKQDSDKLDEREKALNARQRKIEIEEKANLATANRNIDKDHEISARELKVKTNEKKIKVKMMELKLNG